MAVDVSSVPSRWGGVRGRSVEGGGGGADDDIPALFAHVDPFQVDPAVLTLTPVLIPDRAW